MEAETARQSKDDVRTFPPLSILSISLNDIKFSSNTNTYKHSYAQIHTQRGSMVTSEHLRQPTIAACVEKRVRRLQNPHYASRNSTLSLKTQHQSDSPPFSPALIVAPSSVLHHQPVYLLAPIIVLRRAIRPRVLGALCASPTSPQQFPR